jgi:uncharacterized protein
LARVLLLLIIAFLIYLIFRGFFRAQTRKSEAAAKAAASEDMVACARCGVNVPRSEAAMKDGVFYCKDNPRCRAP